MIVQRAPSNHPRAFEWKRAGASVQGPAHRDASLPNQDAWSTFEGPFAHGIVVCDGLGSKPYSHFGSRLACAAVGEAFRIWSREPEATLEELIRLIHALWNIRVSRYGQRDAATTCLFAAGLISGDLLLGQLGDGMVLLETPNGGIQQVTPPRDGFLNETTGLGIARSIGEWVTHRQPIEPDTFVMLATDGISDDVRPERLPDWVNYWKTELLPANPRQRAARIARELENWPRPLHSDDKTLAVMWNLPADVEL